MAEFNNARATWELLSEPERQALAVLGRYKGNTTTPDMLGRELHVTWQRASRTARKLKGFGLVTVKSLPKQTSYGISGQGEACLAAGAEIPAWGTVTDYNRGTPLRPATREEWQRSVDITRSGAPGGYTGSWEEDGRAVYVEGGPS
jgi:hypothetical protein